MAPTRRNIPREQAAPEAQVVDPRNWNVPLVLMIAITGGLVMGAFRVAVLWSALDTRLARIEAKQDAAATKLESVLTRSAFVTWVEDTTERNGTAWKPARIP